jgi:hypothetical protein
MGTTLRFRNWIALLALLFYTAAPLLATAQRLPSVPAACSQSGATHSCACRKDAHSGGGCCCKHGQGSDDCKMGQRPCAPEHQAAPCALWTFSNPITTPARVSAVTSATSAAMTPSLRGKAGIRRAYAPLTPPPQA